MRNKVICMLFWTLLLAIAIYLLATYLLCSHISSQDKGFFDYIYCSKVVGLSTFYAENLRGHLFAAFLALGGFLLSLKTFIIVTMKENVYDTDKYKEMFERQSKLDRDLKLYGSLQELSDFLFYAISASIISALLQMTIGLYPHWVASLIAIVSSVFAMVLLLYCLRLIKQNLDSWFDALNEEK